MIKALALGAVAGAAYWVVTRCQPDPRTWPDQAKADLLLLKGHIQEAVAAGRRAAAAKDRELLEELGLPEGV